MGRMEGFCFTLQNDNKNTNYLSAVGGFIGKWEQCREEKEREIEVSFFLEWPLCRVSAPAALEQ